MPDPFESAADRASSRTTARTETIAIDGRIYEATRYAKYDIVSSAFELFDPDRFIAPSTPEQELRVLVDSHVAAGTMRDTGRAVSAVVTVERDPSHEGALIITDPDRTPAPPQQAYDRGTAVDEMAARLDLEDEHGFQP